MIQYLHLLALMIFRYRCGFWLASSTEFIHSIKCSQFSNLKFSFCLSAVFTFSFYMWNFQIMTALSLQRRRLNCTYFPPHYFIKSTLSTALPGCSLYSFWPTVSWPEVISTIFPESSLPKEQSCTRKYVFSTSSLWEVFCYATFFS